MLTPERRGGSLCFNAASEPCHMNGLLFSRAGFLLRDQTSPPKRTGTSKRKHADTDGTDRGFRFDEASGPFSLSCWVHQSRLLLWSAWWIGGALSEARKLGVDQKSPLFTWDGHQGNYQWTRNDSPHRNAYPWSLGGRYPWSLAGQSSLLLRK